jgi:hypothetical protein
MGKDLFQGYTVLQKTRTFRWLSSSKFWHTRAVPYPLSTEAFQELQDLQTNIQGLHVHENENETDYWQYVWGFSKYSSKQLYNLTISLDMEIKMQK